MSRVAVIGAGLFGSIISHTLSYQGHEVVQIDAGKEGSGSRPAACLMKPSWFSGALARRESEAALDLLDQMYGVEDLQFTLRPTRGLVTVHWVRPSKVLQPVRAITRVEGEVVKIRSNGVPHSWMVIARAGEWALRPQHANVVIVAAGVWCNDILVEERGHEPEALHVPGLQGRAGSAFLWRGIEGPGPFIAPWAPYKQIVGFDRGDGYWIGDGSSIKPENWTERRSIEANDRCARAAWPGVGDWSRQPQAEELHGIRPYVPGAKPCYLAEHHEGVWVCTGGAKNGTIAAAWAALQLSRRLA